MTVAQERRRADQNGLAVDLRRYSRASDCLEVADFRHVGTRCAYVREGSGDRMFTQRFGRGGEAEEPLLVGLAT